MTVPTVTATPPPNACLEDEFRTLSANRELLSSSAVLAWTMFTARAPPDDDVLRPAATVTPFTVSDAFVDSHCDADPQKIRVNSGPAPTTSRSVHGRTPQLLLPKAPGPTTTVMTSGLQPWLCTAKWTDAHGAAAVHEPESRPDAVTYTVNPPPSASTCTNRRAAHRIMGSKGGWSAAPPAAPRKFH